MARRRQGGKKGLFKVDELIDDAVATAQVPDPADVSSPALEALAASLDAATADTNIMGCRRARRMLIDVLVKRLRLEHYLATWPEIREERIARPIFLVGPPRSGTTFLHRLLSQDPDHRTPRLWEAMQPPPPTPAYRGDPAYFERDYRVEAARRYLEARLRFSPDIGAIHSTDVDVPEECFGLLETSLRSHSFLFYAPVFDYIDWLDGCTVADWTEVYELYADQLRLLQWWYPGERWVLKTPFHLWAVDALCAVFPDALIVQQHRTPAACVASFCSLTETAFKPIAPGIDRQRIGQITLRYLRDALARNAAARASLGPERFVDIPYDDLVSDPMACAHRVYRAAGVEPDAGALRRMEDWLPVQARSRGGKRHDYSLDAFGLSEAQVDGAFAPYSAFVGG